MPNEILYRILEEAPPKLREFLKILRNTGLRVGELQKLEWEDVDLKSEHIHVRDSKNFTQRTVPLKANALRYIQGIILAY